MRTTLTLDSDVAALLRNIRKSRKLGLKEAVNLALRQGLLQLQKPARAGAVVRTQAVDLGECLVGDIDNVAEALAAAEGEGYR
jgi:hypothetical protein